MYRTIFDAEEKLWSGVDMPPVYTDPTISLGHVLLRAMKLNPTKVAQISANSGLQFTYEELHTKAVRAAQNIQKMNFRKGDVFAVISKNNHDLVPIVVALLSTGHPLNALDPSFSSTEITHMLGLTKPKLIFTEICSYEAVKISLHHLGNDANIFTFDGQIGDSLLVADLFTETGQEADFIPIAVDGENDTAAIICSSGTTGIAKGVCLTHAALLDQTSRGVRANANDITFSFSTLYWLSGVQIMLLSILDSATRIITTDTFTPELMLRLVEQYKISFVLAATYQSVMCVKCTDLSVRNVSSVRFWRTGSKVPLLTVLKLNEAIGNDAVHVGYGMSELAGIAFINSQYPKTEANGQLLSSVKVKIVDDDGNRLGVGRIGEICFKTIHKFGGYCGDLEGTVALFDSEGFLKSGDFGYFDENGLMYLVDRKNEFLKYRNYMISPAELVSKLIWFASSVSSIATQMNCQPQ